MTNHIFDQVKIKFEKFLSVIGNVLTCEKELRIIQNKFRRHFNTTISDYLCSNQFILSLDQIQNAFTENNKSMKYYTLLNSFDEQLKKHAIKSSRSIPSTTHSSSITTTIEIVSISENLAPIPIASTMEDDRSLSEVQETIEYLLDQCCNILPETLVIDQVISITTNLNSESKRERKILRLERRLNRLSRIIRELEEKDMSLDEMAHCDLYEVESNLKKQACQIHAKLSKLTSQSSSAERILHQPITLNESETGHPLINKDLQEMVNQSKNCPSFTDVLDAVEKSNDKYQLHWSDEARRKFAEKSFKIIGKEIKTRRMADFQDIMYSRLPEDFNIEQDDPALNNAEIEQVLTENQREADFKTEKIFEEYSRFEPDPELEIYMESTEDELPIEREEVETINEPQEIEYDVVDILPPFSSAPLTPQSNSIEAKLEISLKDRPVTILSTASLPVQRTTYNRESAIRTNPQSTISKEQHVETLIPRQKKNLNDNEIIYQLYKQRLTNNEPAVSNKRPSTKTSEYSNVKKPKQQHQPEIIVLD